MLVEVVSVVLMAPMDSTSEVSEDGRDLSLLLLWRCEDEREREHKLPHYIQKKTQSSC